MTVLWAPAAISDLRSLRQYIATDAPGLAAVVVRRIRTTVQVLDAFPHQGRPGRAIGTRELVVPRTPYVVVYRTVGSDCQIVRVLHGAQDWPTQP